MKGVLRFKDGFLVVEYEKDIIKRIYWSNDFLEEKSFPGEDLFREYFLGKKVDFSELKLDFEDLPLIYKKIYTLARNIPYGKVISYQGLAIKLGNKNLQRVVGNAMSKNPFLIVVPCHRVVRKDGSLGKFSLGVEFKKWLLNLEGVEILDEKISGFRYWWD